MRSRWLSIVVFSSLFFACRSETPQSSAEPHSVAPPSQANLEAPQPEEEGSLNLFGGGSNALTTYAGGMFIPPSQRCTISRIGPRSFLTAGHCVTGDQAPLTGILWLENFGSSKNFTVAHRVRQEIKQKNSNPPQISDYAIISVYYSKDRHEEEASWIRNRFTALPVNSEALASGLSAVAYGWGKTSLPPSTLPVHAGINMFSLGRIIENDNGLRLPNRVSLSSDPADTLRSINIPNIAPLGPDSMISGLGCGAQRLDIRTISTNNQRAYLSGAQLLNCPVLPGDSGGPLVMGGSIIAINQGYRLTGTLESGAFYESTFSRVPKDVVLREINRPIVDSYEILDEAENVLNEPELYAEKKYKIRLFGANLERLNLRLNGIVTRPNFRLDLKDYCSRGAESCVVPFTMPRPVTTATTLDFSFRLAYERSTEKDGSGASGSAVVRSFEERSRGTANLYKVHNVWDAKACTLLVRRDVRKPGQSVAGVAESFVLPVVTLAPEQPAFIPLPKVEGAAIFEKQNPALYEQSSMLVAEACRRLPAEADMCGPLWFGTDYVPGQTCSNYRCGLVPGYGCYSVSVTRQGNYFRGLPPDLEFALGLIQ